jgi:hypothetical protein
MRPAAAARCDCGPTMNSSVAVLVGCLALLVSATGAPTPGEARATSTRSQRHYGSPHR